MKGVEYSAPLSYLHFEMKLALIHLNFQAKGKEKICYSKLSLTSSMNKSI